MICVSQIRIIKICSVWIAQSTYGVRLYESSMSQLCHHN